MPNEPRATQHHHDRLLEWEERAQRTYEQAHHDARTDPQRSGHVAEETWAQFLRDWLPPSYTVRTRRYIIPEVGETRFETDIVVLRPSYPPALRDSPDVLASGVAAAFSVKLTLKPDGVRDAVGKSKQLRSSMLPREGTVRSELLGAYPFGLLSLSHGWTATPRESLMTNVLGAHEPLDGEFQFHPRELIDFVCVADLACISAGRVSFIPGIMMEALDDGRSSDTVSGGYLMNNPQQSVSPVASFISGLLTRLSYDDPELRPLARGLMLTGLQGTIEGTPIYWAPSQVYSQNVLDRLATKLFEDIDWAGEYH